LNLSAREARRVTLKPGSGGWKRGGRGERDEKLFLTVMASCHGKKVADFGFRGTGG